MRTFSFARQKRITFEIPLRKNNFSEKPARTPGSKTLGTMLLEHDSKDI